MRFKSNIRYDTLLYNIFLKKVFHNPTTHIQTMINEREMKKKDCCWSKIGISCPAVTWMSSLSQLRTRYMDYVKKPIRASIFFYISKSIPQKWNLVIQILGSQTYIKDNLWSPSISPSDCTCKAWTLRRRVNVLYIIGFRLDCEWQGKTNERRHVNV